MWIPRILAYSPPPFPPKSADSAGSADFADFVDFAIKTDQNEKPPIAGAATLALFWTWFPHSCAPH